jgi:hypothetical protein
VGHNWVGLLAIVLWAYAAGGYAIAQPTPPDPATMNARLVYYSKYCEKGNIADQGICAKLETCLKHPNTCEPGIPPVPKAPPETPVINTPPQLPSPPAVPLIPQPPLTPATPPTPQIPPPVVVLRKPVCEQVRNTDAGEVCDDPGCKRWMRGGDGAWSCQDLNLQKPVSGEFRDLGCKADSDGPQCAPPRAVLREGTEYDSNNPQVNQDISDSEKSDRDPVLDRLPPTGY